MYQARWRPPGDGTELNRRARTFATKREAKAWLNEQDHDWQEGSYIDPRRGGKKLAKVADEWAEAEWHHLKPRTKADTRHILDKHIVPVFGERRVGPWTPPRSRRGSTSSPRRMRRAPCAMSSGC